ncbi:HDOD domain-containing protein [Deefgea piscis]|uniref:HDOD domain-containing protein n=1 Tax=Deefgea piscis TaxID=2739061 RepID=UPI001C8182D0|nr:HDOD domain-containing protein [Deefgea piscis]QZA81006.1 HDOD domain-containing protein [Deefgea piscis]
MMQNNPKNLASWINIISHVEIPILASTKEHITKLRSNMDCIDLRDLAYVIGHDPLLSLKMLKYQVHRRSQQQVTDITNIEKVLLMIGIKEFFEIIRDCQILEEELSQNTDTLQTCLKTCARAYYAAQLAETMSKSRRDIDPKEIITAALLHETAEILLWLAAPELMLKIRDSLKNNPEIRSKSIQKEILGCTVNELQQELIIHWHLPKILLHLVDESYVNDPRVLLVLVSTSIARHTEWSWNQELNYMDIEKCAQILHISNDEAHTIIVNTALRTAKEWNWYQVETAAARIIEY